MSFWSQRRDDSPSTSRPEPATPARPASPAPSTQKSVPRAAARPSGAPTVIAAGSTFVGEITGQTELLIKGVVKGEIDLDSRVVVGPEGRVEGDIHAESIEIAGKVNGNVRCESLLKVHSSGSLEGEVVTVDLDVDSGCFLSGRVQRVKKGEVSPGKGAEAGAKSPGPSEAKGAGASAESPAATDRAAKDQATTDRAATDRAAKDRAAQDRAAKEMAAKDQAADEKDAAMTPAGAPARQPNEGRSTRRRDRAPAGKR